MGEEAVGGQISFRVCFLSFLEGTIPAAATLLFQHTNKREMRISVIINRAESTVQLINLHIKIDHIQHMFIQKESCLSVHQHIAAVLGVRRFLLQQSDYDRLIGVLFSSG